MIHNDTVYCVMIYVSEVSKRPDHKLSLLQKGLGGVMSAGVFLFEGLTGQGLHNSISRIKKAGLMRNRP